MDSLPIKYRPKTIEELWGNTSVKESLEKILTREDPRPAYLFTGPPGCGKTTLARIVKEALGIVDFDFYKYNTSNTRGIDTARKIAEDCLYGASAGKAKMYLFEEAHGLTPEAWNCFLDLLEHPPGNTFFAFCTSEFERIGEILKKAIHRRCAVFEVNLLNVPEMRKQLNWILDQEGFETDSIELLSPVIDKIITCSGGSPGEALSLLDTIIEMDDVDLMLEKINESSSSDVTIRDICKLFIDQETDWKKARDFVKNLKGDAETNRRAIVGYLGAVLLNSGRKDIAKAIHTLSDSTKTYGNGVTGLHLLLYMAITKEDLF